MLAIYRLPDPLPGEQVLHVIHRDAFIALKRVLLFVVLLALPVALLLMINNLFPALTQHALAWPTIVISASGYLLFIWLLFFFSMVDYALDLWVITDRRIIDVRQSGFFSRTVAEQNISRIQDVSSNTSGFWPTIFKYGNVSIQTAGQQGKFHFEEIAHPDKIRDVLIKLSAEQQAAAAHATGKL